MGPIMAVGLLCAFQGHVLLWACSTWKVLCVSCQWCVDVLCLEQMCCVMGLGYSAQQPQHSTSFTHSSTRIYLTRQLVLWVHSIHGDITQLHPSTTGVDNMLACWCVL